MPAIVWSDEYSINVKEMDDQHKKLADIINEFDNAVQAREEEDILKITLENLMDYTETHFTREEELMMQHKYPAFDVHKEEHNSLTHEVIALYKMYKNDDKDTATKIAFLLGHWLLDHIMKEDKKYGAYLNSKGIT